MILGWDDVHAKFHENLQFIQKLKEGHTDNMMVS
jgi:hypothetical protein